MATEAYERLLGIQDLDVQITQLEHRYANHPAREAVASVEAQIAEVDAATAAVVDQQTELDGRQKVLDDEVAGIEKRRSEIDGKLYDGSVTATKDLLALQDEAAMLLERQRGVEDSEIEIMELLEPVLAELDSNINTRASLLVQLDERTADLERELADVQAELDGTVSKRAVDVEPIPLDLLAAYDELRTNLGGVAVARLTGKTCGGCHMELSAVSFDRMKKEPDDAVVHCDQCGRILIR